MTNTTASRRRRRVRVTLELETPETEELGPDAYSIYRKSVGGKEIMARKLQLTFTDAELYLLEVLWQKGSATVAEALEALPKRLAMVKESVDWALSVLETKGFARRERRGGALVFHPVMD